MTQSENAIKFLCLLKRNSTKILSNQAKIFVFFLVSRWHLSESVGKVTFDNVKWILRQTLASLAGVTLRKKGKGGYLFCLTLMNLFETFNFRHKKTTSEQFIMLVREMDKYPEVTKGKPVFGANRIKLEATWSRLVDKLNSIGPPQRTMSEWKKVFYYAPHDVTKCQKLGVE